MHKNSNVGFRITISCLAGVAIGVLILHPAAMFIMDFRGLKPTYNWDLVKMTFTFQHFPMTIFYAYLGAFIGLLFGLLNARLSRAQQRLNLLEGMLPICPLCKKINDGKGSWETVEDYMSHHTKAPVSSRFCTSCAEKHFPQKI